jgi:hypothetical protein
MFKIKYLDVNDSSITLLEKINSTKVHNQQAYQYYERNEPNSLGTILL